MPSCDWIIRNATVGDATPVGEQGRATGALPGRAFRHGRDVAAPWGPR